MAFVAARCKYPEISIEEVSNVRLGTEDSRSARWRENWLLETGFSNTPACRSETRVRTTSCRLNGFSTCSRSAAVIGTGFGGTVSGLATTSPEGGGDLGLGAPRVDPERLDEIIHAAGGDAFDVCLHDHGVQRLIDPAAGLQQRREEAPMRELRDLEFDVAGLGRQRPGSMPPWDSYGRALVHNSGNGRCWDWHGSLPEIGSSTAPSLRLVLVSRRTSRRGRTRRPRTRDSSVQSHSRRRKST